LWTKLRPGVSGDCVWRHGGGGEGGTSCQGLVVTACWCVFKMSATWLWRGCRAGLAEDSQEESALCGLCAGHLSNRAVAVVTQAPWAAV
jgi:hypothetical protein